MHFFSPVERMPLLEVIPTEATSPRCHRHRGPLRPAHGENGHRGGRPSRVLGQPDPLALSQRGGHLLQEGVPIELIDRTMTRFGFPVGPVALLDEVGLDVAEKAGSVMHEAFGERMKPAGVAAPDAGRDPAGAEERSRLLPATRADTRREWTRACIRCSASAPATEADADLVQRRLVYAMLNEAALACADSVVRSPRDADIGAIFGIGFPAFRGGPLRMIDDLGAGRGGRDAVSAAGTVRGAVPSGPARCWRCPARSRPLLSGLKDARTKRFAPYDLGPGIVLVLIAYLALLVLLRLTNPV